VGLFSATKSYEFQGYLLAQREQVVEGRVVARDQLEAEEKILARGIQPVEIVAKRLPGGRKPKTEDLALFSKQLANLLQSGVPPLSAIETLISVQSKRYFRDVLESMYEVLQMGLSLSNAFAERPDVFPERIVKMIAAGETQGRLVESLQMLAEEYTREASLRKHLKSALAYPIVVIVVAFLVFSVIVLMVVPKFAAIYEQAGLNMSFLTKFFVFLSHPVTYLLVVLGMIGLFSGTFIALKLARGENDDVFDNIKLKIPGIGPILYQVATIRFLRTLQAGRSAGLVSPVALDMAIGVLGNKVMAKKVAQALERVQAGEPLADSVADCGAFDPLTASMLRVSLDTGAGSDEMISSVIKILEEELEAKVNAFKSVVEPVAIVVVGLVVGSILVSLYMPMFQLYSKFGQQVQQGGDTSVQAPSGG